MIDWVWLGSGFCFMSGGFLCITGGVGLLRFPDFFCRVHAAGVTETLATPLLLTGVMLQLGWSQESLKLLFVMVFVLATNPTAAHAMAKAALQGGLRPQIDEAGLVTRLAAEEEHSSTR